MTRTGIARAATAVALLMTVALVGAVPAGGAPNEDWPMFRHDPLHTGTTGDTGLEAGNVGGLNLQW